MWSAAVKTALGTCTCLTSRGLNSSPNFGPSSSFLLIGGPRRQPTTTQFVGSCHSGGRCGMSVWLLEFWGMHQHMEGISFYLSNKNKHIHDFSKSVKWWDIAWEACIFIRVTRFESQVHFQWELPANAHHSRQLWCFKQRLPVIQVGSLVWLPGSWFWSCLIWIIAGFWTWTDR